MSSNFSKPVRMSGKRLEASRSEDPADIVIDPAERAVIAAETARLLITRGHDEPSGDLVERLVRFADENGLDTLAELWANSSPTTLPGALWRLYVVRAVIRHNLDDVRALFQRGVDDLATIDQIVAGAPDPLSIENLSTLLDDIVRGIFTGELADALDRAAAVARAVAAGAISMSWEDGEDSSYLTGRSLNWSVVASELGTCARLARAGRLD